MSSSVMKKTGRSAYPAEERQGEVLYRDVPNYYRFDYSMRGIVYVFQAPALKQVLSCKLYPMEAV